MKAACLKALSVFLIASALLDELLSISYSTSK